MTLAGNGWVHVFPRRDQHETIRSINLSSEQESTHTGRTIYAGTLAKLHPTQLAIYGTDNGLSPSDMEKYGISGGAAVYAYDSPYHGDFAFCGNLWISEDGARVYTRCGNTFRAEPLRAEDMQYAGALPELERVGSLDHTSVSDLVAAIPGLDYFGDGPDDEIRFFDHQFLQAMGTVPLPGYSALGQTHESHGRFVFFGADDSIV